MMLIYVTICDSAGRDASVLLDVTRIAAIAPYTESTSIRSRTFLAGLSDSRRPGNRSYLEVYMGGMCRWVVPVSEWPHIKAALVRVNGGGFNRFGNDTESLECPRYLQTPATGAAACEEGVNVAPHTANLAAIGRELFSADAISGGMDMWMEAAACSSSR